LYKITRKDKNSLICLIKLKNSFYDIQISITPIEEYLGKESDFKKRVTT
ncbi:unnamed protein product, partial [marine sediment metagenome]